MSTEVIVALSSVAAAFLSAVVGPIAVHVFQKWLDERKKKRENDPLKLAIGLNILVTGKLEEIRQTIDADRVFLCQFHNGGHFYPTGQSIQKFSMVYEVLNGGVSSQQQQFQNIPIGLFSKSINILADGEVIKIADYNTDESYGLASFAENNGTKSGYLFPIMTIDNKFIGIVGVDYTNEKNELGSNQIAEVAKEVSSIGGALINEYLNKK